MFVCADLMLNVDVLMCVVVLMRFDDECLREARLTFLDYWCLCAVILQ